MNEQADKVSQAMTAKRKNLESIIMFMQQKIYAYENAQRAQAQQQQ